MAKKGEADVQNVPPKSTGQPTNKTPKYDTKGKGKGKGKSYVTDGSSGRDFGRGGGKDAGQASTITPVVKKSWADYESDSTEDKSDSEEDRTEEEGNWEQDGRGEPTDSDNYLDYESSHKVSTSLQIQEKNTWPKSKTMLPDSNQDKNEQQK